MHNFKMSEQNTNHDLSCLSFADTYKIDTALAGLLKEEPGANFTIYCVFILWLDTGSHVHLVQSVYMHAEVRLSYLYVLSELLVVVPACFHKVIYPSLLFIAVVLTLTFLQSKLKVRFSPNIKAFNFTRSTKHIHLIDALCYTWML